MDREIAPSVRRRRVMKRGIAVIIAIAALTANVDGEEMVSADALQLEQVVLNVVRNAIEAAGEKGSVSLTLRDGALSIADSGPGVSDADRPHLFTPFFTTKRDGRGIGLTVVQEILANHGFSFSLENRGEGGAEFRIEMRG
jgi:two-component system nitrogen regulation sensor histidine kinase NtrY